MAPKGVDVVYDPVGGKSFEEALKNVKWGAQILIIGFASGGIPKVSSQCAGKIVVLTCFLPGLPSIKKTKCTWSAHKTDAGDIFLSMQHSRCVCCLQIAANIALVKNLTFHGVFWGSYMQNEPRVLQQSLVELVTWLDQGRITVPVSHRCFPRQCTLTSAAL